VFEKYQIHKYKTNWGWNFPQFNHTHQERLDDMTHVSFNLTNYDHEFKFRLKHATSFKLLRRVCCLFESHTAGGKSFRSCVENTRLTLKKAHHKYEIIISNHINFRKFKLQIIKFVLIKKDLS